MIIATLVVIGLCLGSFINAFVWRWHKKRNWVRERSECTHCGHKLKIIDLIPVVSWLALKGKCRYCHKKIEDNPLPEISTALLFVLSWVAWPEPITGMLLFKLIIWLLLLVILVILAVYDFKYFLLPNRLVAAAGALVAVYVLGELFVSGLPALIGASIGSVAFGGLFYILFQISKGRWIGGGDVKLGFVLGAWLMSLPLSLMAIFSASVIGTVIAFGLMAARKVTMQSKIPFGPLLIAGTVLATLYGDTLIQSYMRLILGP